MDELFLAGAVFISSGAGYLLGKHYERKRAKLAFLNFISQASRTTSIVTASMIDAMKKRYPDVDLESYMKEVVNECAKNGVQTVGLNGETQQVVKPDVNQTK